MKRILVAAAVIASIGILYFVTTTVRAQQRREADQKLVPKQNPRAQMRAMAAPAPFFPVQVKPGLDPDTKALHEQLAAKISGSPVPNDRLGFFSAVIAEPGYQITGWSGMVESVEEIPGGYLVTVRVNPSITSEELGPATMARVNYSEKYRVVGDAVEYAGFLDPEGMFGQFPDVLGY